LAYSKYTETALVDKVSQKEQRRMKPKKLPDYVLTLLQDALWFKHVDKMGIEHIMAAKYSLLSF
jgi:hypothetical protein